MQVRTITSDAMSRAERQFCDEESLKKLQTQSGILSPSFFFDTHAPSIPFLSHIALKALKWATKKQVLHTMSSFNDESVDEIA